MERTFRYESESIPDPDDASLCGRLEVDLWLLPVSQDEANFEIRGVYLKGRPINFHDLPQNEQLEIREKAQRVANDWAPTLWGWFNE